MKTHPALILCALAISAITFADEVPPTSVGVARVDITPVGPIRLSGYLGRSAEATGVGQKIWAKALAIGTDEQGPAVLVAVDNLGVPEAITAEVAARLGRRAGLARERLSIGSSHTHSAPCLTGVAPNIFGKPIPAEDQAHIDQYTRDLVDKLEKVCLDALADRKPGRLSWSQGRARFAANRRTPGGPVDHSLPVLKLVAPDGTLRAIVANYACHCTTLRPEENVIDGDWAGYAQTAIEADHPGCIALTLVGCGADANPTRQYVPGAAKDHGRALADEVNQLLKGSWTELPEVPKISYERLSLPFDKIPTRAELEAIEKGGGPVGHNATLHLAKLARGEAIPAELPYSAQAWRFGNALAMVFLPGEVVVDYVLRLKKEFDPARLWVTAYANDVPCYIPSERILREGGYEGGGAMTYYARPSRLKPGVEAIIIDAVHRVVGPGFEPSNTKQADDDSPPALSPEESRRAFRTKPGLKVELVASEPLVKSPVAVDFGADGKLWVCEMYDYPSGLDGEGKPGGIIKFLEDRDGDGRYDTATEFLKGVPFPTGVTAWRKGVLICAAPDIIYAEDTDGDGKADVRRTLFEGFATENFQARVNGLALGLDNWVYGANGLIGGAIRGTASGRDVSIGGRDFRMKPDTGEFEPASGLTQQGRVRDDWGNQFGGNNSVLIQHYPLPDHYAHRNPRVAAPYPYVVPAQGEAMQRLYPASRTLARYNEPDSANHVTSACSPLVYRDTLLGAEYAGNSFTCEPVHNLVRRLILEPDGVTFSARKAEDEQTSEFLASTDPWCRPVQVRTGPDGALWVVDMYRFVVEHPRWISPERLATLDVRAGAEKGRIYRVFPEGQAPRSVPRLDALSTRDLASALDSPNGTLRDTVQRLLLHHADREAVPVLERLAREASHPAARAQALCALDGLGALTPKLLPPAIADASPGVRREAVRLSEPWLGKDPAVDKAVLALVGDPAATVRYQVALSLGEWASPEAGKALGKIAVADGADHWIRAALLSSSTRHAGIVLERVVASAKAGGPPSALVEPLIATVAGSKDRGAIAQALAAIRVVGAKPEPWKLGALAELLDGARDETLADDPVVKASIASAATLAADQGAPAASRLVALRLLGRVRATRDADRTTLAERLDPSEPAEIQLAAVRALAKLGDRPAAEAIIARWARLGPTGQAEALDALLARPETTEALVAALESGSIVPGQVDAAHREQFLSKGPETLRERASRVFGSRGIGPRRAVLEAFASAKQIPGDSTRGKQVFGRICAACHKVGVVGHEVGPDLAALTDTSADALIGAILDPNHEVDARYASYTAALKDGRVLTGLIAGETASAITLKRQEGQSDTILRADLEELATSGRSLMPEGLENDLKPADLADLIAFLSRDVPRPKDLDGNRPRTVEPGPDGSLRLAAEAAEVYGPTLTYETEFGNLGYWHSAGDRAAWNFRVEKPSTFTVTVEWACDEESAGNAYLVHVDGAPIRSRFTSTGSWANYDSMFLRELSLSAGVHRLEIQPAGPVQGALADVRAIVFTSRAGGGRRDDPAPAAKAKPKATADELAKTILDPATPGPRREAIIGEHPELSSELVTAMSRGLGPDREEQYRRIPWIWRVAIAAGRRNDADELRRLLAASLPDDKTPLEDWQAVVIGGGLINGITQAGAWPAERLESIVRDDQALRGRWRRALDLASTMTDAKEVPEGTRYDALRMLGVEPWDRRGAQISRYLAKGVSAELQQGAVCALGDVPSPEATKALLANFGHYTPGNRKFTIEALIRDDARRDALLDAVEAGHIANADLGDEAVQTLLDPSKTRSHERAKRLLAR